MSTGTQLQIVINRLEEIKARLLLLEKDSNFIDNLCEENDNWTYTINSAYPEDFPISVYIVIDNKEDIAKELRKLKRPRFGEVVTTDSGFVARYKPFYVVISFSGKGRCKLVPNGTVEITKYKVKCEG